jgi:probable F420-dependent oxidoreductase
MEVYATIDNPQMKLSDVAAHAARAERVGFTGLLVPEAVHDPFLMALLALEHTRHLTVATSVVVAFPRSPTVVAHSAWDLQALSHGRFRLGLGTQVKGNVVGRFATAWAPPVARMRDYVGALRAIWRTWQEGVPLRYESEHYRLDRMQPFFNPGPIESPEIPIYLGGVNRRMMALAGEIADGLMTHPTNTSPRFLREIAAPALATGAARAGREPAGHESTEHERKPAGIVASPFVATGATEADLARERERIRQHLGFLYSTPQYRATLDLHGWRDVGEKLHALTRAGRWAELTSEISDEILDALVPSGTYDDISAVLGTWFDGLATGIALSMPTDPADDARFGSVVSRLRAERE